MPEVEESDPVSSLEHRSTSVSTEKWRGGYGKRISIHTQLGAQRETMKSKPHK